MTNQIDAAEAIRILRHGIDGMGGEGPEYDQCADVVERQEEKIDQLKSLLADLRARVDMACIEAIGSPRSPEGGLPIRHPGDERKVYSYRFDTLMSIVFQPDWRLERMWKEGEKLWFIAGPAEPSPERTSRDFGNTNERQS